MAALRIDLDKFTGIRETSDLMLLSRAYEIAAHAHADQVRGNKEPYVNHVTRVAARVAFRMYEVPEIAFYPYRLAQVQAAAVLHDVVEDCFPENDPMLWINEIGGLDCDTLCLALKMRNASLDYDGLRGAMEDSEWRAFKKKLDFEALAARYHPAVFLIKGEDRIDNLNSADVWRPQRRWRYAAESRKGLLPVLDLMKKDRSHAVEEMYGGMRKNYVVALERLEKSVPLDDQVSVWA